MWIFDDLYVEANRRLRRSRYTKGYPLVLETVSLSESENRFWAEFSYRENDSFVIYLWWNERGVYLSGRCEQDVVSYTIVSVGVESKMQKCQEN